VRDLGKYRNFQNSWPPNNFSYRIEIQIPLSVDVSLLLVYSKMSDNCINYSVSNDQIVLTHELEIMWRDGVMAYFKPLQPTSP
jgi:hypothetical protein